MWQFLLMSSTLDLAPWLVTMAMSQEVELPRIRHTQPRSSLIVRNGPGAASVATSCVVRVLRQEVEAAGVVAAGVRGPQPQ